MTEIAPSIELNLIEKLRDKSYRKRFFLAESSARIAAQLIALRKKRGLTQKEVAELAGTGQPAISRAEQADYQNWSFNAIRSIADVLDARISVSIEAAEDVLSEYENQKNIQSTSGITPEPGDAARAFYETTATMTQPLNLNVAACPPQYRNLINAPNLTAQSDGNSEHPAITTFSQSTNQR